MFWVKWQRGIINLEIGLRKEKMNKEIHEIFMFPYECQKQRPAFVANMLRKRNWTDKKFPIKYWMRKLIFKFSLFLLRRKKIEYIFLGKKFNYLISQLEPLKSLVFESSNKIQVTKNNEGTFFVSDNAIIHDVEKIFSKDPALKQASTQRIIKDYIHFFKILKPKSFVVMSDVLFDQRFLIYCAKKAGIETICIQHGVFSTNPNDICHDGRFADKMYVWSEQQRVMIKNKKLFNSLKLEVLGYPHQIYTPKKHNKYNKSKICILGQPYENYSAALGKKKMLVLENIISQLKNFEIIYKLHPGEKNQEYFPEGIKIFSGNLHEAIEEYDYFISISSTALLEVTLSSKIAIQFFDSDICYDNYENIGLCYSYNNLNSLSLVEYIQKLNAPFKLKEEALLIPDNVGKKFKELEKFRDANNNE